MNHVIDDLTALVDAVEERFEQSGGWSFLPSLDDGAVLACLLALAVDLGYIEATSEARENLVQGGRRVFESVDEDDDSFEVDE